MAEREGFEPPVPCGTPDFESGTFDHSATSPSSGGKNQPNLLLVNLRVIEKKESGPNFPAIRRFTFFLVWHCHRMQSEGCYTELRSLRMQRILGGRLTPSLSQVLGRNPEVHTHASVYMNA